MAVVEYQPLRRLFPIFVVSLFWGTVMLLSIAWRVIKVGPRKYFWMKKRDKRPDVLNDEKLGTHHYARMKNIRLHYVAKGPDNKPLMLFLHGFPEFWYSWRHQLKEFGKTFRAVALDMRGFGESEKPQRISEYHMSKLTEDIKEFIEYLGYKKCILVSHDWGGAVAWNFAAKYPEMVEKLVVCNIPHPVAFLKHLRSSMKQFRMSWYMFFFQNPCLPEIFLGSEDLAFLSAVFAQLTKKGPYSFGDDDLEAYKYSFKEFEDRRPAINYYRAAMRYKPESVPSPMVHCPTLIIWGERDFALDKAAVEPSKKFVDGECTVRYIETASHWVQQEEPELVNSYIREFV